MRARATAIALGACLFPTFASAVFAAEHPNAGYDKGFFVRSDDSRYQLKLGARVQVRHEATIPETGAASSAFSIPRARLKLSGNVFTDALEYKIEADFGKGQVTLKDFFGDYAVLDAFHVRAGQFKRPFSRQEVNSSGKHIFSDLALTGDAFGAGRDLGLMLHNDYERSPTFEWAVAVMNGTGDKGALSGSVVVDPDTGEGEITSGKFSNVPETFRPQLVLRVGYNHGKLAGYSEGDLEGGPLRFGVAGSVKLTFDADNAHQGNIAGDLDFVLKVHGFALDGAFFVMSAQDGTAFTDQSLASTGVHAQASYLIAGHVMPLLRYARVMPDGGLDRDELAVGVTGFLYGHNVKLTVEAARLGTETASGTDSDWRLRTQVQVGF
jgi:phosphate-selective porin OprO/OprP